MAIQVPAGFRLAGVACGLKSDATQEDLTLIVADEPCVAAGVYTQNLVFAAPVGLDRERTPTSAARCVVVNAANANACTGQQGWDDAVQMARWAEAACGADEGQGLVMSTGIIGEFLPMAKIEAGIHAAADALTADSSGFASAARGILTTDKGPKVATRAASIDGQTIELAGMAKGAGMIGPRMATMLAVVLTDANITDANAQSSLLKAVERSFNSISVEGHMSTNDTVLLLASGKSQADPLSGADLVQFEETLTELCIDLAKQIPADGEGASHLLEITVAGCTNEADARTIAKTVGESALVKTAATGNDPNWGRIVSAIGYAGIPIDPNLIDLKLNDTQIYESGSPLKFDEAALSKSMSASFDIRITIDLNSGDSSATFWSSDLTCDYVRFNSEYHT